MNRIDFKETQRFKTRWAWAGVVALNILFIYAIVQQVIFGIPFGPKPAPDLALILIGLIPLLLLIFLFAIKLKTRINEIGIYFRFYPFQFKETEIEWQELTDAYMRNYNSLFEYGGWGIRKGTAKTGMAINSSASSTRGLQLQFNNGKLLLIGTKKPDEIHQILDVILSSGKINRRV